MTQIEILPEDVFFGICEGPFSVELLERVARHPLFSYAVTREDPREFLPTCVQSFLIDMPCSLKSLAMNNLTGYRRTMAKGEEFWGGVFQ